MNTCMQRMSVVGFCDGFSVPSHLPCYHTYLDSIGYTASNFKPGLTQDIAYVYVIVPFDHWIGLSGFHLFMYMRNPSLITLTSDYYPNVGQGIVDLPNLLIFLFLGNIWLKMECKLKFAALDWQINSKYNFDLDWNFNSSQYCNLELNCQSNAANSSWNFIFSQMIFWESVICNDLSSYTSTAFSLGSGGTTTSHLHGAPTWGVSQNYNPTF